MGKRILFIAPDETLARDVASALPELAAETVTVRNEREALVALTEGRPLAVVALDMPSRSALGLCNAVRRAPEGPGIPVVVVCGAQLGDAVDRHQKLPTRADVYLNAPCDGAHVADALRSLLGLAPAAEISLPPPEPVVRAAPPPVPPGALKPGTRPSGARDAIAPPVQPVQPASPPLGVGARKESGVMPASSALPTRAGTSASEAEATRLRREVLELTRRTGQLQARLAEAEERARSFSDALETATRQRAESDAEWTEWVTSAEGLADEAWKARESLSRDKERLENELAAAQARIAMLEGDLSAARSRTDEESARAQARSQNGSTDAEALASAESEARVMAAEIAAAERLARACREIRATMAPAQKPADPDAMRTTEWVRPDDDAAASEAVGEGLPEVVAAVRRLKLERDQFARQATRLAEADATIRRLLLEQRQARAESARALAEMESRLAARPAPVAPGEAASAEALRSRVAELERELSEARTARGEVDDLQREVEFLTAEVNRYAARARQA